MENLKKETVSWAKTFLENEVDKQRYLPENCSKFKVLSLSLPYAFLVPTAGPVFVFWGMLDFSPRSFELAL